MLALPVIVFVVDADVEVVEELANELVEVVDVVAESADSSNGLWEYSNTSSQLLVRTHSAIAQYACLPNT